MCTDNKRVLISGGSRGIGKALCKSFADNGYKVAFIYKSNDTAASGWKGCEILKHPCRNPYFGRRLFPTTSFQQLAKEEGTGFRNYGVSSFP